MSTAADEILSALFDEPVLATAEWFTSGDSERASLRATKADEEWEPDLGEGPDVPTWHMVVPATQRTVVADAIARADERLGGRIGRASRREIRRSFEGFLPWVIRKHDPARSSLDRFVEAVYATACRRQLEHLTPRCILREVRDDTARDEAIGSGRRLGEFVETWRARVWKDVRARPSHWRIPEMANEDTRDAVVLSLVEAMIAGGDSLSAYERAGCEATYRFLVAAKDRLRRERKTYVPEPCAGTFPSHHESAEDLLLGGAHERVVQDSHAHLQLLRRRLPHSIARWLPGLLLEAQGPKDELNLARIAKNMNRHRSNASRALLSIRHALEADGFESPWKR